MSENCKHHWITNNGYGGEPEFHDHPLVSKIPVTYVRCSECDDDQAFSEDDCVSRGVYVQIPWRPHSNDSLERNRKHTWIANNGYGGLPVFSQTHLASDPIMHVKCSECCDTKYFWESAWLKFKTRKPQGGCSLIPNLPSDTINNQLKKRVK